MLTFLAFGATFAGTAVATPSVVDQYTEQIPTPTGQTPSKPPVAKPPVAKPDQTAGGDAGSGAGYGYVAPPGSARAPEMTPIESDDTGSSGKAKPETRSDGNGDSQPKDQSSGPGDASEDSPAAPAAQSSGLGSGMGAAFPLAMLLVAVGMAALLFIRRNARNGERPG